VLGRLLVALADEDDALKLKAQTPSFAENGDSNVWPPWPWPPWGGNGDDDDDKKPVNRTEQAYKLAKKVVKFERKIAKASLDL
jgi:endothelin-converting enzyme